jgi:hypothetical protein
MVLTRRRMPTVSAKCQAVANRQACLATGTAPMRMSRTSIVITTGIGITVTGIDESDDGAAVGAHAMPLVQRHRHQRR